jgi:hypothetical protein
VVEARTQLAGSAGGQPMYSSKEGYLSIYCCLTLEMR